MNATTTKPATESKLAASVAAEQLGIKAVTLRKYSTMVEKQLDDETRFRSEDNRHRLYSAADLATFEAAIKLSENGTTLATALAKTFNTKQAKPSSPAQPATPKQPVEANQATPQPQAPAVVRPADPDVAELAKQQVIIIRRLESLSQRLNQAMDQLDRIENQQAKQAARPWWRFW